MTLGPEVVLWDKKGVKDDNGDSVQTTGEEVTGSASRGPYEGTRTRY